MKKKKWTSLALALIMCLGLTVPAFAAELGWKLSVSGKTDAEVFVGGKTFILRDWNFDTYDPSCGEIVSYNLYKDNVCVLAKGDTAVFAYTKPEQSTNHGGNGFGGAAGGSTSFNLEAWSDLDGDGVYDRRMIRENYDYEGDYNTGGELAPGNWYEVLPVGTDVDFWEMFGEYQPMWYTGGGDLVRMSADRVLELFGPNTLVKIKANTVSVDPAAGDWYILVEGNATQPTGGPQVSDWAKEQVNRAAEIGLVPDSLGNDYRVSITRAQFAATAVKLYEAMSGQKAPAAGESPFSDTSDPAVIQAQALGIVSGVGDGKFAADAPVTREQAAAMLSRVYTNLGGNIPEVAGTTFDDNGEVSDWARDAVAFMADKGIVSGVGNNSFDPLGNASIEQALVIALRMFDNLK